MLGAKGFDDIGVRYEDIEEPTDARDDGLCGMDGAGETTRNDEGGSRPSAPPNDCRPVLPAMVGVPGMLFRGVE